MTTFDWMESEPRPVKAETTLAMRRNEIAYRARLFAALGFTSARAQQRLRQNLVWEYERVGKPRALKDVASLVASAYGMVKPRSPEPKPKAKPAKAAKKR